MTISTEGKKISQKMIKVANEVADEYGYDVSESQIRTVLEVGLPCNSLDNIVTAAETAGIDAWIADLMIYSAITTTTKPEQPEYP